MGVVEVGVVAAQVQLDIEEIAVHCLECFARCAQIYLHLQAAFAAECHQQLSSRLFYTSLTMMPLYPQLLLPPFPSPPPAPPKQNLWPSLLPTPDCHKTKRRTLENNVMKQAGMPTKDIARAQIDVKCTIKTQHSGMQDDIQPLLVKLAGVRLHKANCCISIL